MSVPIAKLTQLPQKSGESKLINLAKQMKAEGQEGLWIEKENLQVKNLSFLGHFGHLKFLKINGVKAGCDAVTQLSELEELSLMYLKQFKCAPLGGLPQLKELGLDFMSITSWNGVEKLVELERLTIYQVSGMPDLAFVTQLARLESLHGQGFKEPTTMPDLSGMHHLTHLWLSELSNLEDIAGVFQAPALKKLVVSSMAKLSPEQLQPAVDHRWTARPTLRRTAVWRRSSKIASVTSSSEKKAAPFGKKPGASTNLNPTSRDRRSRSRGPSLLRRRRNATQFPRDAPKFPGPCTLRADRLLPAKSAIDRRSRAIRGE